MFDSALIYETGDRRLHIRWSIPIPGLIRVPLFSARLGRGFVVSYVERTKVYELISFDPRNGDIFWKTNLANGGYGSIAVGSKTVAVPTKFIDVTGVDADTGEISWVWQGYARVRSPINICDESFLFSCGASIIGLNNEGRETLRIEHQGVFFYGLVRHVKTKNNSLFISLASFTNGNGRSNVGLFAFYKNGDVAWKIDFGSAHVISSDTSGFAINGEAIYCAAGHKVAALNYSDGSILWEIDTDAMVGRQIPIFHDGRLFVPSVSGSIYCLNAQSGDEFWRFTDISMVNTPISILGDLALASVSGQIRMLSTENGRPFDQIAAGHSPYSAITFFNDCAFIGGGDPPYHGRLYAFDLKERQLSQNYICKTETVGARDNCSSFTLHIEVSNVILPIIDMILDSSVISEFITNGVRNKLAFTGRDGNRFTFDIPIRASIVPGLYCVDVDMTLKDNSTLARTVLIEISRANKLPSRVILHDIMPIAQITPKHSGAAVIAMAKDYYGQEKIDQADFRQLVDKVREASDYEPFNLWRIVVRRALSTQETCFEDLPEVKAGAIQSLADDEA